MLRTFKLMRFYKKISRAARKMDSSFRKYAFFTVVFVILLKKINDSNRMEQRKDFKIVCYLGSWANYRTGNGKFLIENIDPFLCTHLVYGFAKLQNNQITPYDPYLDLKENWGLGAFQRFNALKEKNPELKTLIAIGGWNEGSSKYSTMVSDGQSRKAFIESCLNFMKNYKFDGIDMDWEYPTQRGGSLSDRKNFVLLLKEMKDAFKPYGYLLTAAVSASYITVDAAYDVPEISRHLDFMNVMTYDFHGGWNTLTGHNSPLFPRPDESDEEKKLNSDYAIRHWLKRGAPAEKLVLGIALYGRSFTLQNPQVHGLGAKVVGKGTAGRYTRENGFLGYNEICETVNPTNGWTIVFEENHKAPYAYKDRQWVGFDNEKSVRIKVDYIKRMNLGGGMVWSIETDDFRGLCHDTSFPLVRIIKSGFDANTVHEVTDVTTLSSRGKQNDTDPTTANPIHHPSTTNQRDTTVHDDPEPPKHATFSTEEDTATSEVSHEICEGDGYYRDPTNCKRFVYCLQYGPSQFITYEYKCGPGTVFSQEMQTCAFPYQVPECQK